MGREHTAEPKAEEVDFTIALTDSAARDGDTAIRMAVGAD